MHRSASLGCGFNQAPHMGYMPYPLRGGQKSCVAIMIPVKIIAFVPIIFPFPLGTGDTYAPCPHQAPPYPRSILWTRSGSPNMVSFSNAETGETAVSMSAPSIVQATGLSPLLKESLPRNEHNRAVRSVRHAKAIRLFTSRGGTAGLVSVSQQP